MQLTDPGRLQSSINVTPLVDVVLVLLIIFMVIAPQMQSGPEVDVPSTDRPAESPDDGRRLVLALDASGALWIEDRRIDRGDFAARMREAADGRSDREVVIRADAGLSFGQVKRALLQVEAAGFHRVGLVAERLEPSDGGL